jgi:hypothetical protein
VVLGKTQHEIENGYAWVDLPDLLKLSGEARARELLENIQVSTFPHMTDVKAREAIMSSIRDRLPKAPPTPLMSAEEQYQVQMLRMRGG